LYVSLKYSRGSEKIRTLTEKQVAEIVNDSDSDSDFILKSSPSASSSSSEYNEEFWNHQITWFSKYFVKEIGIPLFTLECQSCSAVCIPRQPQPE
jgi:hypothetical protein